MSLAKVRPVLVSFFLLAVVLFGFSLVTGRERSEIGEGSYKLEPPSFIKLAFAAEGEQSAFPADEAGIASYFKGPSTINLNDVRSLYRTVEQETSKYIIGSIAVAGYASESEDVHVYIHVDGWVMAYYLADDPAAKAFDWVDYDGATITTKLDNVLKNVAATIGSGAPSTTYYHFQYPDATDLMLIAEGITTSGSDSFDVNLPSSFTYYERSWSLGCSQYKGGGNGWYYLNDVQIVHKGCPGFVTVEGTLTPIQLPPDSVNTIRVNSDESYVYGGLGIVYRVP